MGRDIRCGLFALRCSRVYLVDSGMVIHRRNGLVIRAFEVRVSADLAALSPRRYGYVVPLGHDPELECAE